MRYKCTFFSFPGERSGLEAEIWECIVRAVFVKVNKWLATEKVLWREEAWVIATFKDELGITRNKVGIQKIQ